MRPTFEVHDSHAALWERDDWRYAFLMGGRGNGRSGTASRYSVSQVLGKEYLRGALMRAVHSDIRSSSWAEINDRINEQGIREAFHITDNDMFLERGKNSLRAHGFKAAAGSLTARLKSLANYNYAWIEEGEEIGELEFRKLDDSLRTTQGRIRIVFTLNTPSKNHWIIRQFFDLEPHPEAAGFFVPRLKPEYEKDAIYIPGTFRENLPNLDPKTVERYKHYKATNPSYYWQVIEGLSPEVVRGRIYTGWQQIAAVPPEARLVRFGVDWGWYPDPLVIVALYYWNGGYIADQLVYDTNVSDEEAAAAIKQVPGWETVTAACGADEPKSIEALKKYRVRADKSVHGPGSVDYRIKATAAKRMYVTSRSTKLWESYENYHWAEDRDGNPKGEPEHAFSDGMDGVGYAVASINPLQQLLPSRPQQPRKHGNIAV